MMKRIFVVAVIAAAPLGAQQQADTLYVRNNFVKREARIVMRDGVHLFTTIYVPKDTTRRYPILLRRTPYSAGPYGRYGLRAARRLSPRHRRATPTT